MALDLERYDTILVVSNDAGAAHVLSSFVKNRFSPSLRKRTRYCLRGSAKKIFAEKLGVLKPAALSAIKSLERKKSIVVTGRSFVSGLERDAIKLARQRRVACITFMDHWDCYAETFLGPSGMKKGNSSKVLSGVLPDKVVVGDKHALFYARSSGIPAGIIEYAENEYFRDLAKFFNKHPVSASARETALFLCEPTSAILKKVYGQKGMEWGYNEMRVLSDVLSQAGRLRALGYRRLLVRPHPSEKRAKYASLIRSFSRGPLRILLSKNKRIENDILDSSLVIGTESMGLAIAILAGRRAVSYLPSGCPKRCSLPHGELMKIDDIKLLGG